MNDEEIGVNALMESRGVTPLACPFCRSRRLESVEWVAAHFPVYAGRKINGDIDVVYRTSRASYVDDANRNSSYSAQFFCPECKATHSEEDLIDTEVAV